MPLVVGGLIGGLAATLYVVKATKIYSAVAELEMSVRRPKVINSQAVYDDGASRGYRDTDAIINTRFAKFRSPTMEKMAIEEYRNHQYDKYDQHHGTDDALFQSSVH